MEDVIEVNNDTITIDGSKMFRGVDYYFRYHSADWVAVKTDDDHIDLYQEKKQRLKNIWYRLKSFYTGIYEGT